MLIPTSNYSLSTTNNITNFFYILITIKNRDQLKCDWEHIFMYGIFLGSFYWHLWENSLNQLSVYHYYKICDLLTNKIIIIKSFKYRQLKCNYNLT